MKALLDTNIIIHRENTRAVSNYSIGHLYKWLDALRIEKVIHPLSVEEIESFQDETVRELLAVKIQSYTRLVTRARPDTLFLEKINAQHQESKNNRVDNSLLYEVYIGHVDILITEDRALIRKAKAVDLSDRVYSINRFIEQCSKDNPSQVEYRMLGVRQKYFGEIALEAPFFDSFRRDYAGFDSWFNGKSNEKAYVAEDDDGNIFGFLYIKTEGVNEIYHDIIPMMQRKKRLKIGSFKVDSTGFRLGERFMKIIFDNAIQYDVDEIYVTLFSNREDISPLYSFLVRWGFIRYGVKHSLGADETVMIKYMGCYSPHLGVRGNFPNLAKQRQKFFLPIEPKYHTDLCPDAMLKSESPDDYISNKACRYALQKVYISFSFERNMQSGDFILMYRKGPEGTKKAYTSIVTSIGVINQVHHSFKDKRDYLNCCKNRSVFSEEELDSFWRIKQKQILVVDFIFIKQFKKNVPLKFLWDNEIVIYPNGPRPFTKINDSAFFQILEESGTQINYLY